MPKTYETTSNQSVAVDNSFGLSPSPAAAASAPWRQANLAQLRIPRTNWLALSPDLTINRKIFILQLQHAVRCLISRRTERVSDSLLLGTLVEMDHDGACSNEDGTLSIAKHWAALGINAGWRFGFL